MSKQPMKESSGDPESGGASKHLKIDPNDILRGMQNTHSDMLNSAHFSKLDTEINQEDGEERHIRAPKQNKPRKPKTQKGLTIPEIFLTPTRPEDANRRTDETAEELLAKSFGLNKMPKTVNESDDTPKIETERAWELHGILKYLDNNRNFLIEKIKEEEKSEFPNRPKITKFEKNIDRVEKKIRLLEKARWAILDSNWKTVEPDQPIENLTAEETVEVSNIENAVLAKIAEQVEK